jgi:DMSO/TMAO reductase YedYZ molybdopterin-dependent catalytic subunit
MKNLSRRKIITTGIAATAGVSGLAAAARIADRYGLVPPDSGGLYGAGHTLTYASQRLITAHSLAREFPPGAISPKPFANGKVPKAPEYQRLLADNFAAWRMSIEGLVARPASLSIADLRSFASHSQITHLACEEGWSYVAQWTGASLADVLQSAGIRPEARYIVYFSMQPGWSNSIDMADALHPQTILTYEMNGAALPPGFGGPLRMRVPRQLGYKSVKYVNRLVVTDSLKRFKAGGAYSWYAGI